MLVPLVPLQEVFSSKGCLLDELAEGATLGAPQEPPEWVLCLGQHGRTLSLFRQVEGYHSLALKQHR